MEPTSFILDPDAVVRERLAQATILTWPTAARPTLELRFGDGQTVWAPVDAGNPIAAALAAAALDAIARLGAPAEDGGP
jgi:hypothetical protein